MGLQLTYSDYGDPLLHYKHALRHLWLAEEGKTVGPSKAHACLMISKTTSDSKERGERDWVSTFRYKPLVAWHPRRKN